MTLPSLPIEIWQMILGLACAPSSKSPRIGRIRTNFEPVKMSHVCKTWRDITISNPQLWTNFFFYVEDASRPSVELTKLYLERSQNCPLNVSLEIAEYGPYSSPDANPILATLFDNFERWKTAKLFIAFGAMNLDIWRTDLYCKLRREAPLLEILEVSCQVYLEGNPDDILPSSLWKNASRLTKLAITLEKLFISDLHEEWLADMRADLHDSDDSDDESDEEPDPTLDEWVLTIGIPYPQLTHLLLDTGPSSNLTWTEIASIFSVARSLESCTIRGINKMYETPPNLSTHTVLKHLKHLYLSAPYNKHVSRGSIGVGLIPCLDRTLTAPSLQTLSVINADEMWDTHAYTRFITRSDCPLSEIHFWPSLKNDQNVLLEWIRLSSSTIRVISSNQIGMFLKDFASRMSKWDNRVGEFELCPNLEKIAIYYPFKTRLDRNPFLHITNMLKTRLHPPNESPPSFTTFSIPFYIGGVAQSLEELVDAPYYLDVQHRAPNHEPDVVWDRE